MLWEAVVVLSFDAVRCCVSCIFVSVLERSSILVLSAREAKAH